MQAAYLSHKSEAVRLLTQTLMCPKLPDEGRNLIAVQDIYSRSYLGCRRLSRRGQLMIHLLIYRV